MLMENDENSISAAERFGDRFEGFRLVVVQDVYWPVFVHKFRYSRRAAAPLNLIEEALLRLVGAGVTDPDEARQFLGIGPVYLKKLVEGLCEGSSQPGPHPLRCDSLGQLQPGEHYSHSITTAERIVVEEAELNFFRDAVFDLPVNYGDKQFDVRWAAEENFGASWLGPQAPALLPIDAMHEATAVLLRSQKACSKGEIIAHALDSDGDLAWIKLLLACYEGESKHTGRLLLFNPADTDRPLHELGLMFEGLLEERVPELYYPPDPLSTATKFWSGIAALMKGVRIIEDLQACRRSLECEPVDSSERTEDSLEQLAEVLSDSDLHVWFRRYSDAEVAHVAAVGRFIQQISQPGESYLNLVSSEALQELRDSLAACKSDANQLLQSHTLLESLMKQVGLQKVLDRARERALGKIQREEDRNKIVQLESSLRQAPKVSYLSCRDHRPWLIKALETAKEEIVIVSPWIKRRVLSSLLPHFTNAIGRGCTIWIGHGMPPNAFHRSTSDEEALATLDKLAPSVIRTDRLGTHEKVLICDDAFCITTSYNWLSYDGTERRERGVLVDGPEVRAQRYEFISVISRLAAERPPERWDVWRNED